jgi:hypothetical protein
MDEEQQGKRRLVRKIYEYSDGYKEVFELQGPETTPLIELIWLVVGIASAALIALLFIATIL